MICRMDHATKRCTRCGEPKALGEFNRHPSTKDGRQSQCRACAQLLNRTRYAADPERYRAIARESLAAAMEDDPDRVRARRRAWVAANKDKHSASQRKHWLKKNYGLTPEQYGEMLRAQGGSCAICGSSAGRLRVDHDHQTNEPRGLLCHNCNVALGHFSDSPALLLAAERYLQQHRRPTLRTA